MNEINTIEEKPVVQWVSEDVTRGTDERVEKLLQDRWTKSTQRMPRFKSMIEFINKLPGEERDNIYLLLNEKGILGNRLLEIFFMLQYGTAFEIQDLDGARRAFMKLMVGNLNELAASFDKKTVETLMALFSGLEEFVGEQSSKLDEAGMATERRLRDTLDRLVITQEALVEMLEDCVEQSKREIQAAHASENKAAQKWIEEVKVRMQEQEDAHKRHVELLKVETEKLKAESQRLAEDAREQAVAELKGALHEHGRQAFDEFTNQFQSKIGKMIMGAVVAGVVIGIGLSVILMHALTK